MSRTIKLNIMGFLLLFIILILTQNFIEPKLVRIKDIKINQLNKHIKIKAKIQSLNTHKNMSFLILEENNTTIKAVFFNKNLQNLNLEKEYFFYGKVELYKQDLQLNLKKIKSIN